MPGTHLKPSGEGDTVGLLVSGTATTVAGDILYTKGITNNDGHEGD
jgi:hypothetical protein